MTRLNIQGELYDLWFNHYTKAGDDERTELVQAFIDDHLGEINPADIKAKHPAHGKRQSAARNRLYSIAEILADFIIRAEGDDSGLTASPQTEINREYRRNEREEYTNFSDLFDGEEGAQAGTTGLTEYDVYKSRGDLYPDFTEEDEEELTVDEFKEMIERVKENAEEYARMYSEKYRKDYKEVLHRIRRLDVERIAICEECGEVYYKHDLRRRYCDLRPSCEVNAKRRRESKRYSEKRSVKVKVRADKIHYIIEGKEREPFSMAR